jgi:hypothetical protein
MAGRGSPTTLRTRRGWRRGGRRPRPRRWVGADPVDAGDPGRVGRGVHDVARDGGGVGGHAEDRDDRDDRPGGAPGVGTEKFSQGWLRRSSAGGPARGLGRRGRFSGSAARGGRVTCESLHHVFVVRLRRVSGGGMY